jgi:MFS family permease
VRVLQRPIEEAGLLYGLTTAVGVLIGSIGGGALCDVLTRRDRRWIAWFPALAFALAVLPNCLMFFANDLTVFLWVSTLGWILLNAGLPAVFAAAHAVCGSARRATAIALLLFLNNLLGFGLGPAMTGALSDAFSAHLGAGGLRYALSCVMILIAPAAMFIYSAARTLPQELED